MINTQYLHPGNTFYQPYQGSINAFGSNNAQIVPFFYNYSPTYHYNCPTVYSGNNYIYKPKCKQTLLEPNEAVTAIPPRKAHNPKIVCANCGGHGHIYKQCNHPITSFGVICFRMAYNSEHNQLMPQYLMVQRKDSLSYVEFLRGKYSCDQRNYILKLFSNMTEQERANIQNTDFDILWKTLWQVQDCNTYIREYNDSKNKFAMLKKGYHLKDPDAHTVIFFNIAYIIGNSKSELLHTEWGFPKGRRNINEEDFTCAFREFREETGISIEDIDFVKDTKPFEEVFSGSNHIRYKHIYYLAMTNAISNHKVNPRNKLQCKEVKDMKWLWYDEAQSLIRDYNIERKELFRRVNVVIMKNISTLSSSCNTRNGRTKNTRYKTRKE